MMNSYREIELDHSHASTARAPREARLPEFIGAPEGSGEKLSQQRIAVVGSGSVGQMLAMQVARLQVAQICLVDSGSIKETSLLTHSLAFPEDLGHPKAPVLGRLLKRISPDTRVRVYHGPVSDLGLMAFASVDLVALATDNLLAEVEVGRYSRLLGLPLVQSSVHGGTLTAQVRFFGNDGEVDGPCPVCGFGKQEMQNLYEHTKFSCDAVLPRRATPQNTNHVTASTSFLCALGAEFAVMQIVRHWLGLGRQEQVVDNMLNYCGFTHETTLSPLKRNRSCTGEHAVYRRVPSHHAIPDCSPRQLLMMAGLATKVSHVGQSFKLDGLVYSERGRCGCPVSQMTGRFHSIGPGGGEDDEICGTCGEPVRPQPFYSFDPVPVGLLEGNLDRPLKELGVVQARFAVVRGPEGGVLVSA